MQEKDILNKIIDNDGRCEWILPHMEKDVESAPCYQCPLSKLEKRKDGSYRSCHDSLIKTVGDAYRTAEIYKEAASKKLMEIQLDDELIKLSRREKIVLVGNLNNVLFKLGIVEARCCFRHNQDITIWQVYETQKQWKSLKDSLW